MAKQKSLSPRAWTELIILSVIWGGSFLSIRLALDEMSVLSAVAHRVFWAALVLWGYVIWRGLAVPRRASVWAAFLIMGLLNNVIPFSLMAWGQLYIPTGLTAILNATTAIFGVLVAAAVFADETLSRRKLTGVLLGFAGVAMAIGPSSLLAFDPTSLAQLAVLGGTFSYALAGSWARKFLTGMPPQMAAAGMLTGSAVIMVPATVLIEGGIGMPVTLTGISAVAYYAIIATALAYLLYYRVLTLAGAGNLLLCTLMIPPVAILLGALVLHERLSLTTWAGFVVLALGMLVIDGRLLRIIRRDTH